jgi:hypothetical protein
MKPPATSPPSKWGHDIAGKDEVIVIQLDNSGMRAELCNAIKNIDVLGKQKSHRQSLREVFARYHREFRALRRLAAGRHRNVWA